MSCQATRLTQKVTCPADVTAAQQLPVKESPTDARSAQGYLLCQGPVGSVCVCAPLTPGGTRCRGREKVLECSDLGNPVLGHQRRCPVAEEALAQDPGGPMATQKATVTASCSGLLTRERLHFLFSQN